MVSGLRPQWFAEVWTQLPLPRLLDDDDGDDPDRWSFSIVALDGHGRATLPAAARAVVVDDESPVRVSTRGDAVVMRRGGGGRPVNVDGRGRVVVPVWLRDAAHSARAVLVGTRTGAGVEPLVVLAPPRVLTGVADTLVGER